MTNQPARALIAEVKVDVHGTDWTLRLDFNALAEFEEKTGSNAMQEMAKIESGEGSIVMLRHFVWSCLRYHHPDVTLAQAGDVLSHDPQALGTAVAAAFGEPEEGGEAPGKKKAPRQKR